jgi:hypothetical protein
VDPITLAEAGKDRYVADQRFILRVKQAIRASGTRLILVTHPKQGMGGKPGLDGLAGGAAFQRFPHTVLWVEPMKKAEELRTMLHGAGGDVVGIKRVNRKVRVYKARNGSGAGHEIGMWFEAQSFVFSDCGVIQERD